MSAPSQCPSPDPRSAPRISIYLAAALYCDGCACPVKIRNMSATGALVEGGAVPAEGSLVQLVRGALIVHALVAWSHAGQCGLKFSGCVDVQKWRAAPVNAEQQRVDEVVRLVKAGAVPLPLPPLSSAPEPRPDGDWRATVSKDLKRLGGLLEQLGDSLAGDPDLVARHGPALQNLDIAMQIVGAVERMIGEEGDSDPAEADGLRRSADQALRREG